MGGGTLKHWDTHLAKATRLVNTRGSANRAGPAQSKLPRPAEGDKVPVVHIKNTLVKTVWVIPASGKGRPFHPSWKLGQHLPASSPLGPFQTCHVETWYQETGPLVWNGFASQQRNTGVGGRWQLKDE